MSVSKLVQSKIKTPEGRQTLDNYMNWQLVKGMRGALSKKYQDAGKILEKALIGTEIHDERWRECVRDTDKTLGFAVGAMFIKNAFDGDSKDIAEEMVVKVKEAFQARLNELSNYLLYFPLLYIPYKLHLRKYYIMANDFYIDALLRMD